MFNFSASPFKLEKSVKSHSRRHYFVLAIAEFIVIESFAYEILSLPINLNELNIFTFNGFSLFLGHFGAGFLFLIGGLYLFLLYFLAYLQIETRLNRDIIGTAYIIDVDGFHVKNPHTQEISKSYFWNENYILDVRFVEVSNVFLIKVIDQNNDGSIKRKEKISIWFLKKCNIDKFLLFNSFKDQNFTQVST